MKAKLTIRKLNAMQNAVSAMLAGDPNQGDWPKDLPYKDLADAEDWILQEIMKREATQ